MTPRHTCLVLLVAFSGGCASKITVPEKSIVVTEDQTEMVTPIGSHIKVRVLKGQQPTLASPSEAVGGEQVNNSLLTRDGTFPNVPIH